MNITCDISQNNQGYDGIRRFSNTRRDIPDPPPAQQAPEPHDEENMDARGQLDLTRRRWSKPSTKKQEKNGFKDLATVLSQLPKPAQGSAHSMSVALAEAMEAGFLPALDEDQAGMFTPSELRLYQHAHNHRLLSRDILGYPSLFADILGLST